MKVGDRIVLHKVAFPQRSDQRDHFVVVRITEVKPVPNSWGNGTGEGLWAVREPDQPAYGDNAGQEFSCCWTSFPDDSMSPYWTWWCADTHQHWFDITQGLYCPPRVPAVLSKVMGLCNGHKTLYLLDDGCVECRCKCPPIRDPQPDPSWVGWD